MIKRQENIKLKEYIDKHYMATDYFGDCYHASNNPDHDDQDETSALYLAEKSLMKLREEIDGYIDSLTEAGRE